MREPSDNLFRILLFLRRIFPVGGRSFALAEAANVDASADKPSLGKVGMSAEVTNRLVVVLAVGQVFKEGGVSFTRRKRSRQIQSNSQTNAIAHRNPGILDAYAVRRRGTSQCRDRQGKRGAQHQNA